jgi:Amt family ammonium transporter
MNFDTGSTGFMLVATSLVMLMTPGLAFFYGGLVGRKQRPDDHDQSFVSLGWTTVIWFICRLLAVLQRNGRATSRDHRQLRSRVPAGIDLNTIRSATQIPLLVFVAYQMMFAIITPALITGAFANRVRFAAYMIFLTALAVLRVLPAGATWSGAAACWASGACWTSRAASWCTTRRAWRPWRRSSSWAGVNRRVRPHSIPLVALGTGLLWFGWYGFNAGSELRSTRSR